MKLRDPKSIIIILSYGLLNGGIIAFSYVKVDNEIPAPGAPSSIVPEYTEIEGLEYFHLKDFQPQMSLDAATMQSKGDDLAEFTAPQGTYQLEKDRSLSYEAKKGRYLKNDEHLELSVEVKLKTDDARYEAAELKYYLKKDLVEARGGVSFQGVDPKTRDELKVSSQSMRATPNKRQTYFTGRVVGRIERKKKYEGMLDFKSRELHLDGTASVAHLLDEVFLSRQGYRITAQKADIHLENYNKSLKYFVLNDDVKVTETIETPHGAVQRRAFAERLEGFGRDQKMVLSGAPRVEQGEDLIKGYRITIRENVDLIEVDDAMSDVQIKKQKRLKE